MDGGLVYADHAGATLFSASQLQAAHAHLMGHPGGSSAGFLAGGGGGESSRAAPLGNPHSDPRAAAAMAAMRARLLAFYGASPDDYELIFTSGGALMCARLLLFQ